MSESPAVLYLEADDEITSVVRRVRDAEGERVIVVAPGRSRAISSAVALRLLARAGDESGREIAIVGDALTRSLAAEAGIAAFATLDDARHADPTAAPQVEARHAAIHVVRGTEETAARPAIAADEVTRAVPAVAPASSAPRRRPLIAVTAAVLATALLLGLAGAAVLPGATVTIDPLTEEVGPVAYVIEVAQPEVLSGTAEAAATVTATGEFDTHEPATGVVVLFNWSSVDQTIAAGTLVAAGDQAFETQADVVVRRGSLTSEGTIEAGEATVAITASAPGPAANVAADAIDTVLSQDADARLRGFPENSQRRVTNPEPTSGGVSESGSEITQADVDAATEALTADLRSQVANAVAELDDAIVVQDGLPEPTITGLDGLVGARDRAEATIEGTLAWEAHTAERGEVLDAARAQLAADASIVPAGHELVPDSIELAIEEANLEEGAMRVDVSASGRSWPQIDVDEVAQRVAGLSADDAEAALEDLGNATVELWPDWVASVPAMSWRIEVRVAEP